MAVAGLIRAVLHWTGYGEEGALTFNYTGGGGGHSGADLNAAAAAALDQLQTSTTPSTLAKLSDRLTANQTIDSLKLYEYDTAPGPATGQGEVSVSQAGDGSVIHPLQTAVCVSLITGLPGASYRGRLYMPGHTIGLTAADPRAQSAQIDQVVNLAVELGLDIRDGIAGALSAEPFGWVVYSPTKRVATPIISARADNVLDTQRRREASLTPTHTYTQEPFPNPV